VELPSAGAPLTNPLASTLTTAGETGYFQPYAEFAKTLRTWFVGYGVGAPALILTQHDLRQRLIDADRMRTLGWLFLSGVLVQVLLAWLYKTAMWELYLAETDTRRRSGWWYVSANAITEATWVEVVADIVTIVLFSVATIVAFVALTGSEPLRARSVLDFGYMPTIRR
jgi:hypothetical protein